MQITFRYDVLAGVAGDAFIDTGVLGFFWMGVAGVTRIVEVTVWDNPAYIIMTYDGVDYGPEFELDQDDPPMQIPHAARNIQIRNVNAGNNARFQIAGFW